MSLGRVETVLRCSGLVENVCVYGEPRERSLVGLVVPDNNKMKQLAGEDCRCYTIRFPI